MNSEAPKEMADTAGLKRLRKERQATIAAVADRFKAQKQAVKAIKAQLQQPKTVPEVAQATGIASQTVLWYVAALKKYGEVREVEKDGAYFRYVICGDS